MIAQSTSSSSSSSILHRVIPAHQSVCSTTQQWCLLILITTDRGSSKTSFIDHHSPICTVPLGHCVSSAAVLATSQPAASLLTADVIASTDYMMFCCRQFVWCQVWGDYQPALAGQWRTGRSILRPAARAGGRCEESQTAKGDQY